MSNCVTVQHMNSMTPYGNVGDIGYRLAQLDPRTRLEVVRRAAIWARNEALQGIAELRALGLTGMGQAEAQSQVDTMIASALGPIIPGLQQQVMAAVQPAVQKAVDIMKPTLQQELPVFAVITGAVAAFFTVLGMWLMRRNIVSAMR